ncbi:MAG: polymerase beta domain protein region [Verrucomicrobia bacterium]|nr:polymerase beta domain protein region [Verrucomicrobiota bacterium]
MSLLTVLFPQVRAEVLRLLFTDIGRELHLRDLARQTHLSLKTVQNELAKLSHADLVTSARDGNRRYYQANASHPLFVDLRQVVLKTSGLREALVEAVAGLAEVKVAFVFGSLAAGDGKGTSDVDLMVIGDIGMRALAPRLRKAAEKLGREINPVTMSALEFSKGRKKSPFVIEVMNGEKLFIKGGLDELG